MDEMDKLPDVTDASRHEIERRTRNRFIRNKRTGRKFRMHKFLPCDPAAEMAGQQEHFPGTDIYSPGDPLEYVTEYDVHESYVTPIIPQEQNDDS